jgi:hypothetical protein
MAEQVELLRKQPENNTSPKPQLHLRTSSSYRIQPYIALVVLLAIACFLCVTPFVHIYVRTFGDLSRAGHALYITGITVAASLITSHAIGQIRQLWVLLYTWPETRGNGKGKDRAAQGGNVVIGLSTVLDQARFWPITVSFIAAGLITTAIVAGLAPTPAQGRRPA